MVKKGWKTEIIEGVCTKVTDGSHWSPKALEQGYYMASVKDMEDYGFNLSSCKKISEEDYVKLKKNDCIPQINDVLIAKDGSYLKHIFVWKNKIDLAILSSIAILRPNLDKIDPYFLSLYLLSPYVKKEMKGYVTGAALPRIILKDFKKFNIRIPEDLKLQQKIASILSNYDHLIENNEKRIKLIEQISKLIYEEWFVNYKFPGHEGVKMIDSKTDFGKIPEGWEIKKLGEIIENVKEGIKKENLTKDLAYLPIDLIPRKSMLLNEIANLSEAQSSLTLFNEGDILFGSMRSYFHKVILAPFKGVTRKTCFTLRSKYKNLWSFSYLTLFQDKSVAYANQHSNGATIPYAVWDGGLENLEILVPDEKTLNLFEKMVSPMLRFIMGIFFKNQNFKKTRDLLLPKLISGELDVSNLDIEINKPLEVVA